MNCPILIMSAAELDRERMEATGEALLRRGMRPRTAKRRRPIRGSTELEPARPAGARAAKPHDPPVGRARRRGGAFRPRSVLGEHARTACDASRRAGSRRAAAARACRCA